MGTAETWAFTPPMSGAAACTAAWDGSDTLTVALAGSGKTIATYAGQAQAGLAQPNAAFAAGDPAGGAAVYANLGGGGGNILAAPVTFTYGASGAAPASGTYTTGTMAVDQNGIPRVCLVGGSPGTWARALAQPWQFWVADYGAKGDGVQAFVTISTSTAVINTTALGAPSAPTLSNSGSGGSLTAGTYQVKITYVNRWGETVASSATSQAISGTQPLTITSPAPFRDATGWNAYVTAAGGSTYFLQGATNPVNVPLVLTANPVTTTANPPGSDTTARQAFTSTAIDSSKNYMICGGGGAVPGGPQIGTIVSVQSPTQATLDTAPGGPNGSGLAMVFASDDRVNIDYCQAAAQAYGRATGAECQVLWDNKIYGVGTGFFTTEANATGAAIPGTFTFNTQVRLPVANVSGEANSLEVQQIGSGWGAHCQFWMDQGLSTPGTTIVSFSVGPNTPDATYGQQSIMGGPSGGFLSGANGFSATKAVIRGIALVQPGWSNSIGLDLGSIAGCDIQVVSTAYGPSTVDGGGVNPYSGWFNQSFWINNKIAAGIRLPNAQNNDEVKVDAVVQGVNNAILSGADHVIFNRLSVASVDTVLKLAVGGNTQHEIEGRISAENYNNGIVTVGTISRIMCNLTWDAEETSSTIAGNDFADTNGNLFGDVQWSDFSRTAGGLANIIVPTVSGCQNLRIHNVQLTQQVYDAHAYAYTLGTAFQNPWWETMLLTIAGGTVSGITIGETSATATQTVPTAAYPGFKLPTGWWINIAGSVKPTTFYAVPN